MLPGMIARGSGHIVNVSSYAGKAPIPGLSMYCASKSALVALSVVMPSAVATELSSGIDFPFEKYAKVTPEQVAKAIVKTIGKKRAREIAVPRWMGALGADSQVGELNTTDRLAYQTRLDAHIKNTSQTQGSS